MSDPESPAVPFADLPLAPELLEAVSRLGYTETTRIQAAAIPVMVAGGDIIGRARTGSGKTAAFGLPMLQRVRDGGAPPRALVMAPTRELALQVTQALRDLAKVLPIRIATVYGGAPYPPQIRALERATVVVGTPGRLLDHLRRGNLDLGAIEVFVLDEADEMLRMGFIEDVQELLEATPEDRQIALFSATMPSEIRRIAQAHLRDPTEVQVEGSALTVDHIDQQWMRVPQRFKVEALRRVLQGREHDAVLVFARTRAGCAEVADELTRLGVSVDALHGDLSQPARERVLGRLRARRLEVVIATDVAARGLDVDHITHVVNFDLPSDTETYVHRIGRTGRGGRPGTAITFATGNQRHTMRRLAQQLKVDIDQVDVPSDAQIAALRRQQLQTQLLKTLEGLDSDPAAFVTQVAEASGQSVEAVAAAAVQLLADHAGTSLAPVPDDVPPSWARPAHRESRGHHREEGGSRPERDRPPRRNAHDEDTNEVELFLPIGRSRNIRPGDVVGALANEAGIDGSRIGRIQVFDRKTFVGVPRAVAQQILERASYVQIRGNEVPVAMARPRKPRPHDNDRARRHTPRRGNRDSRWEAR